jgi:hypothetical protein
MDALSSQSIEWALAHILRYGDTDIFPASFEFAAVHHSWTWLKEHLLNLDLDTYGPSPPTRLLVPKPTGDFRVSSRLDPIDLPPVKIPVVMLEFPGSQPWLSAGA